MTAKEVPPPLHVVATAGHVDHGKSSLILRLTGMDPDRLAEEKRRGLTIDLGFAWTTLPSGREIGFVDVPGHERFIRNMLAGVGPVRLVLFVVAADEGWKPQSEEHLQILDVLGVAGGVVALTKIDAVEDHAIAQRAREVDERISGTRLEGAPVVPCSSTTGQGIEEVRAALDRMLDAAPSADGDGRPRQFIDRVFTIKGAGTVVTGTLTGGSLSVGDEAEVLPSGHRARIRGLQSHKRSLETARPVSRVAVNLAGTARTELQRGDVLTMPGRWRPDRTFDAWIRPVRGLGHALTARGAYKLYAGSAERDARLRFLSGHELGSGEGGFIRISMDRPAVIDLKDAFVLREAGRRETVAGGEVLDLEPPGPVGAGRVPLLEALVTADRTSTARMMVSDRGAVRASDLLAVTGVGSEDVIRLGAIRAGAWLLGPELFESAMGRLVEIVAAHHSEHPLEEGLEISEARALLAEERGLGAPGVAEALLEEAVAAGRLVRSGTSVRTPLHAPSTKGREDAGRLVAAVSGAEPTPPTVRELAGLGFGLDLVKAVVAEGRLVRISPELVVTPAFLARAQEAVIAGAEGGALTVSRFREALGTSRKYAVPLLEYFDSHGLTRRDGDLRFIRS